jgi:ERCC4-type nuclease
MIAFHYKYTDKELKDLLSSLTILIDTREQSNDHIKTYFHSKGITYKSMKLDTGDYSCFLPKNVEMGIFRDIYFSIGIERKNSIDELAQSIKEERFEAELIRSQKLNYFLLLVEDNYENLIMGKYRSQYNPKALLARLKTFEARYGFNTVFLPNKKLIGNFIYHDLFYKARNLIKSI